VGYIGKTKRVDQQVRAAAIRAIRKLGIPDDIIRYLRSDEPMTTSDTYTDVSVSYKRTFTICHSVSLLHYSLQRETWE
jgi:hypothetical protein